MGVWQRIRGSDDARKLGDIDHLLAYLLVHGLYEFARCENHAGDAHGAGCLNFPLELAALG